MNQKNVLVVGGGAFGSTLASILSARGRHVKLWVQRTELKDEINKFHRNKRYLGDCPLNKGVIATNDLENGVKQADVVLIAVPSQAFRDVARALGIFFKGDHIVVHVSKGLELESHCRMTEILRQETCVRKIGVMTGPNLAKELILGQPSGAIIASRFPEVCQTLQELFAQSPLKLYRSEDMTGAEICGAYKNIIAFIVGIADGMGYGDNTKALLATRGYAEMVEFGMTFGACGSTFCGLAGIGDLMATCYSPLSRNRQVGCRVGKGDDWREVLSKTPGVIESIGCTKVIYEESVKKKLSLPLVEALFDFLYHETSLGELGERLMSMSTGAEISGAVARLQMEQPGSLNGGLQ